jgi:uncharacterized protein
VRTLGLLGLVAFVLVATAIASPWVAWGAAAVVGRHFTFARVYDRVFEVLLVAGLWIEWQRLDLGGPAEIGFRRQAWASDLVRGLAVGLAGLAAGVAVAAFFGSVVPALRFPPGKTLRKALLGAAAAVAIGAGEEVVFRGVVLRRIRYDTGEFVAVVATTLVYAAVHVIRARSFSGPVHLWSGMQQTIALLAPLADGSVPPQVIGLSLLGVLLAVARIRSGALWLPIGIHAAFVAAFRVGRLFFEIRPTPAWLVGTGWPPLIGGVAGWIAVGVAAALLLAHRRRMA